MRRLYFNVKNYHKSLEDYIKQVLNKEELDGKEVLTKEQMDNVQALKYQEYFEINISTALIYQEHLRWAMFYFLYDYKGMKLSQIRLENKKIFSVFYNRGKAKYNN